MNHKEALTLLQSGNERFIENKSAYSNPDPDRRYQLTKSQQPYAVIVTCSDSRVVPEFIFDKRLGDLFVIRVAGNVVNDHVLGSIEYAVEHLGSKLVIVLGHEHCGAVKAAVSGMIAPGHIQSLIDEIAEAVENVKYSKKDLVHSVVEENVRIMVEKVKRSEPILLERIENEEIEVIGGVYDLKTGRVTFI